MRRLGIISTIMAVTLLLVCGLGWLGKATPSAAAQNPQQGPPQTAVPSSRPDPQSAPPGTVAYVAQRGESVPLIARHFLSQTSYLTSAELAEGIRKTNGKSGNAVKRGDTLFIPGILDSPITEKAIPVGRDFEVRAVYLTGVMAGSDHGLRIIRRWRELGGNAVVFDIKDSDGILNIPFDYPLGTDRKHHPIPDLPKFAWFLHSQGMHAIARIGLRGRLP